MKIVKLIYKLFFLVFGKALNYFFQKKYIKLYVNYLKFLGVHINGEPAYISSDVYFDGHDYSKITINDSVVLSREVMLLTHDYSIARGIQKFGGIDVDIKTNTPYFLNEIYIGENSFIGARASLLPGTHIGDNCIIGAGAVVKGNIPDDSIVVGNPAKIVGSTQEWTKRHIEKKDFIVKGGDL
ncbi:MAG: acyltransferase [Clostridia bacterium]|nr:acyltransferase [Clostridia bacterium]